MTAAPNGAGGRLMRVAEAAEYIRSGRAMSIAGDEAALANLPRGAWIGGTTPYFIGEQGAVTRRDAVFVDLLPDGCGAVAARRYDADGLTQLLSDAPDNGFTLVVLPAFSPVYQRFALDAPAHPDAYLKPLVGWVAGVHRQDPATRRPLVMFGPTGEMSDQLAVALHVALPPERRATVGLVNPLRPGAGPVIRFPRTGFTAVGVTVNGASTTLARHLRDRGIDPRLPLVADLGGARLNVGIRASDPDTGDVSFYAPVFEGIDYRFAESIPADAAGFATAYAEAAAGTGFAEPGVVCAFNCVLNYWHGAFEGDDHGLPRGAVAFGEIAYQLVNQSLVFLRID